MMMFYVSFFLSMECIHKIWSIPYNFKFDSFTDEIPKQDKSIESDSSSNSGSDLDEPVMDDSSNQDLKFDEPMTNDVVLGEFLNPFFLANNC